MRRHRLLLLADLVLDQVGIEHRVGDVDVHGYRLSMSWLFERLVTQVLSEIDSAVITRAQPTYPLDDDARLSIQPDLVFVRDGIEVAVADVKYKLVGGAATVPNPDVYQLITYCTRVGVDTGHLIQSAATPSRTDSPKPGSRGIAKGRPVRIPDDVTERGTTQVTRMI